MFLRSSASFIFIVLLVCEGLPAYAQSNFNSGSTGADGPFAPTTSQTVQLPESGVFNFITVNIPAGVEIRFAKNSRNTPVTILASGNVSIAGTIILDGEQSTNRNGGAGGPGGFNGGAGGLGIAGLTLAMTGDGPGGGGGGSNDASGGGGGYAVAGVPSNTGSVPAMGGPRYGTNALLPLVGGSGGGGGGGRVDNFFGAPGGGGGGAILIASSGTISFSGAAGILARGGRGPDALLSAGRVSAGGGGAGGAIRLVANSISGNVSISVVGGQGGTQSCGPFSCGVAGNGAFGFIRIEAFDLSNFAPSVSPNNTTAVSVAQPKPAILPNAPQLRIASVAGIAAPATPRGSLGGQPDITVPTTQPNPVTVEIEAANIPIGTPVQVTLTPENGARTTVDSTPLAGTQASSTASAQVTLPLTGMSVISATVTLDLTIAKAEPIFIDGERVNRVEVTAVYSGKSEVTYVTQSGRRIKRTD